MPRLPNALRRAEAAHVRSHGLRKLRHATQRGLEANNRGLATNEARASRPACGLSRVSDRDADSVGRAAD